MRHGKSGILAQNPATQERKLRLRSLIAVSSIPLFAIITAFGIAPQTMEPSVTVSTVVEEIALPDVSLIASQEIPTAPLWHMDQIRRDDTLATLLERLNVRNVAAIDFIRHAPEASAFPSQLRPGRTVLAKTTADGELLELVYQLSADQALTIVQEAQGYRAEQGPVDLENRTLLKSAVIQNSLFGATDDAGIPDSVAMQLAEIFSSEIDFHLDLRKGDRFSVVYESSYHRGEAVQSGKVLAAEFINQGKRYQAILFPDAEGHPHYYTPEGKSLQKAFLRSPLEFSRISSGFSLARFHPVLQKWRAHKGVDYAAPIGTRIKATADGTVAFAGQQSGYGNVVMLQHASGMMTVYGHLYRFAPGLKKGQKISQGMVIGQVGMSGVATGPHLHYEFRVNGQHRDPLKVALPTTVPLDRARLSQFLNESKSVIAQLDLLRATNTALLD